MALLDGLPGDIYVVYWISLPQEIYCFLDFVCLPEDEGATRIVAVGNRLDHEARHPRSVRVEEGGTCFRREPNRAALQHMREIRTGEPNRAALQHMR